jgi:Sulfatase
MSVTATESAFPARAQNAFLLHLALSAVAIAQPFYSVTGRTLNFFVAWRMSSVEFTLCILLIYIVPALVTWLLVRLGNRLHRNLGSALLFLALCFYISLTLLMAARQLVHSLPFTARSEMPLWIYALLLIVSASLAALVFTKPKIQGFVRFFAVTTVIFPAAVLLHAHGMGVIRFSEVPPAKKIEAADRPNVILIVYDELPLTTILDADGLIDRNKFPNFYQFARGATWFANARSASGHTEAAVPAILAGRMRQHEVPATYTSYPENIFHRLGPSYNVLDLQFATDLNPARPPGWQTEALDGQDRLSAIALDMAIIFGHIVAPPQFAALLPRIDLQHNRFGEDSDRSPRGLRHHEKFVTALARAEQPLLAVYHNIYPHNGWSHYPSGRSYGESRWGDYLSLKDRKDAKLGDDNVRIMHDYKAHLLQSMHADKLLGELLAQIKANRQYDHSIIAVVADHGVSLWPGEQPRNPSDFRLPDVQAIPLIIKLPGQSRGGISLDPVHTVDIYPTILDQLGVTIPESLQGRSLLKAIREAAAAETAKSTPHRDDVTLKRRVEWFGAGTSMADLYGFGKFSGYVGRHVGEFRFSRVLDAAVHLFGTRFSRASPHLSLRIDAQINGGAQDGQTRDILVALGDRICGATQTTDLEVSGQANSFTLVVAEECVDLVNKGIRVFVVGSDGQFAEIPVEGETSTTVATIDRTIAGLAELIGSLQRAGENGRGPLELGALRERGVAVPELFVRNGRLATRWGDVVLTRDGQTWVVDLYSAPKDACKAIYLAANNIPGVVRIAASASARDETSIPVTAGQADVACSNTESDIIRIIAAEARAPVDRAPSPVPIDQLLAQFAEFIGDLEKAPAGAQGQMTLPALRQLGVAVPAGFVRNGELAWPWGEAALSRSGRGWILDLQSAPREVCRAVQLGANGIPGISRIATSYQAKDEVVIPMTADRAEAACANRESGLIRIITTDTSIARLARDKLAAVWRGLKRTLGGN